MARLYRAITLLVLVFSLAMALVCYGVYASPWWISLVGVAVLLGFVGLGGLLVPPARRHQTGDDAKEGGAALQMMGAFVTTELLVAALLVWISGNPTLSHNDAYQVLGLLIFLALLGLGAQGVLVTFAKWLYVRNSRAMARRRSLDSAPAH